MKKVNYFLMRHGDYYDSQNQFITYHGMLQLKSRVEALEKDIEENFEYKKISLIHSEIPRAKHTALLIKDMIHPIEVKLIGDSDLNCNEYGINDRYVKDLVSECEKNDSICVILSHQPDIESFCKVDLFASQYLKAEIIIEEIIEDEHDDLPF